MSAIDSTFLPSRVRARITKAYRARWGLAVEEVTHGGRLCRAGRFAAVRNAPGAEHARRDALQEGVRWGDPGVFFVAPALLAWIVPVVDGERLLGGVCAGEVLVEGGADARTAVVTHLAEAGSPPREARAYAAALPVRDGDDTWAAARSLYDEVYAAGPWRPLRLERNRENAQQQRVIAEEIHQRKGRRPGPYTFDEERMLLSLIRVGDRKGARRMLNRLLASMFLYSPNVVVVQARAIELLGYLVRAAVEDNPMQEPLLARHARWMKAVIGAREFEPLCARLREALDDFMDRIFLQGYNRGNVRVRQALEYLAAHYAGPVALADVAKAAGVSACRIAHLVKEHTGRTVGQHLRRLRLRRACVLLETTRLDGAAIAYELGFADQSYFIKQFRAWTGTTPARYRRERSRRRTGAQKELLPPGGGGYT